jgi:hypothetical protein
LLDVTSNGRMEVGLARGAYQVEFDRMAGGMPASSGGQEPGVDEFSFWYDNSLPHAEKKKSLELFIKHVVPAFR